MHVMIDIESLGTAPGSTILSIGAIGFLDTGVVADATFNVTINRHTCRAAGLVEDPATIRWWSEQVSKDSTGRHNRLLSNAYDPKQSVSIADALLQFRQWLAMVDMQTIWGNGAAFDNVLIQAAATACGFLPLWDFRKDRCYRTIKNLVPSVPFEMVGTKHDALDDARSQALHLCRMLHTSGITARGGEFVRHITPTEENSAPEEAERASVTNPPPLDIKNDGPDSHPNG